MVLAAKKEIMTGFEGSFADKKSAAREAGQ